MATAVSSLASPRPAPSPTVRFHHRKDSHVKLNGRVVGVVAIASMLTFAAGGSAFAGQDTNTSLDTTYAAVGSDTTDDVLVALSNSTVFRSGTTPLVSSYSATDAAGVQGGQVRTKSAAFSNPNCQFTRPNGSGAGLNALSNSVQGLALAGQATGTGTDCVQFARSSSGSNPGNATPAGLLTYIPFGTDSVAYATIQATSVPKNANIDDLRAIYRLNGTPGSPACGGFSPLIPQAGSGTRNFFATLMGITVNTVITTGTPAANQWGTCVRDTTSSGTPVQEHDGRVLTTAGALVPFSTAQFIAQGSQVIGDNRGGRTVLNAIDFDNGNGATSVSPFILNQDYKSTATAANNATRPVYNVVETAKVTPGNAKYDAQLDTLLTSTICTNTTSRTIIQRYGFDLIATCGSKTKTNT